MALIGRGFLAASASWWFQALGRNISHSCVNSVCKPRVDNAFQTTLTSYFYRIVAPDVFVTGMRNLSVWDRHVNWIVNYIVLPAI